MHCSQSTGNKIKLIPEGLRRTLTLLGVKMIFGNALRHQACAIAMAHNHPSGNLQPSDADYRVLKKLEDAGRLLQIEIRDFLIFNRTQFYSCMQDAK